MTGKTGTGPSFSLVGSPERTPTSASGCRRGIGPRLARNLTQYRKARAAAGVGALLVVSLGWLASESAAQRGARLGQPAPEITGTPWINSEPLSLDKLRGRVVFVEFWTYG